MSEIKPNKKRALHGLSTRSANALYSLYEDKCRTSKYDQGERWGLRTFDMNNTSYEEFKKALSEDIGTMFKLKLVRGVGKKAHKEILNWLNMGDY